MAITQSFEQTITLSPQSRPAGLELKARLAYLTLGDPSKPAVLLPTFFNGTLDITLPFLYSGQDPVLPRSDFFIIITGLLGGGESSSPSNTPAPYNGPNFPRTTYEDNIRLQYALCRSLGVEKLFASIGFSMGGQQAYCMSTLYPDFVENMVCLAGSARTSLHNWNVLEGLKETLESSHDFQAGNYKQPPKVGLRTFDRVFSSWALSPAWFRQGLWKSMGFGTLDDYMAADWAGSGDAHDLLSMLWTWQRGDITIYHPEDQGDLAKTLGRIKARCLIMPSRTDQLFHAEDSGEEIKHLTRGEFQGIESAYGHLAGGRNGATEDTEFVITQVRRFLFGEQTG